MTENAAGTGESVAAIAAALVKARRHARPLSAFPGVVPASLDEGYAIQHAGTLLHGGAIAGWKVGRIWPPFAAQFGSDRLAGPIFAAGVNTVSDGSVIAKPVFDGGFGAVEAEFVFRLGDVPPDQTAFSLAEAASLVAAVHVGIEIASSPLAAINDLGPAVTVSDFGNNHGLIVGPAISGWAQAGIDDWPIAVAIDGTTVGTGVSGDFPDGALGSVRFLLELLARRGIAVPAGTLVSTGAISGVHQVAVGQSAEVRFAAAQTLRCRITPALPDAA